MATASATIAILNGEPAAIALISEVLQAASYEVFTPAEGEEPLAILGRCTPELIILDLQSPKVSGLVLLDIIRNKGVKTPILVVTTPELVSDSLAQQGIAGLLIKPINRQRLLPHVQAILEIQRVTPEGKRAARILAAVPAAVASAAIAPKPLPAREGDASFKNGEKPLVLVVDDEPDMQSLLSDLLTFSGFEVITAGDGMEGLKLAQQKNPDAILLDIMLPKLDGFQMCRLLKFNERFRTIPVIMLTARNHPKDRDLAEGSGADGYIVKPFETNNLLDQLGRLIRGREVKRVSA